MNQFITPDPLKPGDKVGIIAPARSVAPEEMEPAIAQLRSWGLEVALGKHLYKKHRQFAGREIDRMDDLQAMMDDKEIKAIFCARGGYGTLQIIDSLCIENLVRYPKWVVGFSDITVLLSHLMQRCRIKTIHGIMPYNFIHNKLAPESIESLRKALFGESLKYQWKGHELNRKGTAQGILTGGNLSLLYAMIDSPSEVDGEGKILFIEELDEYLYHIERMMIALKRSGRLSRLAGLIIGGLTDLKDNQIPFGKTVEEIIADTTNDFSYPLAFGLPSGHEDTNLSLILGNEVILDVNKDVTLKFL